MVLKNSNKNLYITKMHKTNKMNKKSVVVVFSLLLLLVLSTEVLSASSRGVPNVPSTPGLPNTQGVIDNVRSFFLGGWLLRDGNMGAILRFLFWIFLFAIVYAVLTFLQGGLPWLAPNNIRITLAVVFTLISVFMMPFEALVIAALQYGYVGVLIIMFPLFGTLGYAVFWTYQGPVTLWKRVVRVFSLIVILIALWTTAELFNVLIDMVNSQALRTAASAGFIMFFLIPISLIKKVFK